jgi:hypothetical protein
MALSPAFQRPARPIYDAIRKQRALALLEATIAGDLYQVPRPDSRVKNDSFVQFDGSNYISASKAALTLVRLGYIEAGEPGTMGRRRMAITDKGRKWMANPEKHQ